LRTFNVQYEKANDNVAVLVLPKLWRAQQSLHNGSLVEVTNKSFWFK